MGFSMFGLDISLSSEREKGKNKCFIEREDCHEAMAKLEHSIEKNFNATNIRIDDLKGTLDLVIGLLKNK